MVVNAILVASNAATKFNLQVLSSLSVKEQWLKHRFFFQANSTSLGQLGGILGLDLGSITGLVGLSCSPLSIVGLGAHSCSQQPVCCTGNSFVSTVPSFGRYPTDARYS